MQWDLPEVIGTTIAASVPTTLLIRYGVQRGIGAIGDWVATRRADSERARLEAEAEATGAKTLQDVIADMRVLQARVAELEQTARGALTERDLALGELRVAVARRDDALRLAALWEERARKAVEMLDRHVAETTSGLTTPGHEPAGYAELDTIPPARTADENNI